MQARAGVSKIPTSRKVREKWGTRSVVVLLALIPVAVAQQTPVPAVSGASENQDAPLQVPVTMNGQGGSLGFISETPTESYFSGGIGLTGSYTDNALLTNSNKIDNFSYYVQPHIAWSQITPRFTWNLSAGGGVIFNTNLAEENQAAENADLGASFRLAPHLTLRLDDTFTNTTGLFAGTGTQPATPGVGTVEQGNNTLLVPPGQRTVSNLALVEVTDQVGPNTVVGVRGIYWLLDYPTTTQTQSFGTLFDTRAYSAEAFYNWRFAPRQWFGATLRGQKFQTLPDVATTNAGGLVLYYSIQANKNFTLTFFGGPEYSDTPATAALVALGFTGQGRFWTSDEGATLNWEAGHTSANVSFSRQLNDGGGLASAVTMQTFSAKMRRQLSAHQNEIQLGVAQSTNDLILSTTAQGSGGLNGISAFALFQQRVARSFLMQAGYSWQWQDIPGQAGGPASSNRVWFTVAYDFVKAIGK